MASILLGCAAVISPRVRERRRAKVEREREYADNFAALQEENEKRVKRLSILSAAAAVEQQQNEGGCLPHQRPPGYEDVVVVERRKTGGDGDADAGGRGRRPSFVAAGEERVVKETVGASGDGDDGERARCLRVKKSMVDRRDWVAVAAASTPPMSSTAATPAAAAVIA